MLFVSLRKFIPLSSAGLVVLFLCSCSTPTLRYEPALKESGARVIKPTKSLEADSGGSLTGERLSEASAQGIALHAMGLVGTVYRFGGNTPESGFDCSGLINYVIRLQTTLNPPRTVAQLKNWGIEVPPALRRTGDLIFFGEGVEPTHAGIYVGQGRFVHAPSTGGTVHLSHLEQAYWAKLKVTYRRP
jgi:cell wall-associated NlpC family hydrolase